MALCLLAGMTPSCARSSDGCEVVVGNLAKDDILFVRLISGRESIQFGHVETGIADGKIASGWRMKDRNSVRVEWEENGVVRSEDLSTQMTQVPKGRGAVSVVYHGNGKWVVGYMAEGWRPGVK